MRLSQKKGDFHPEAQVKGLAGCSLIAFTFSNFSANSFSKVLITKLAIYSKYGTKILKLNENKKKNKEIVPIFDKTEFSLDSSKIIQDIQKGIIKYIRDNKTNIDNINKDIIIKEMNKFGNNPSLSDIKYFQDNGKVYHLIEKPKLNKLISNFINTKWKTAYLKRIFKIKLPYNKMVIYLRKLKEK